MKEVQLAEGVTPLTQEESLRLVQEHGQTVPSIMFRSRPAAGEFLRSDLTGKYFQELGSTCLDLDASLGLAEWVDRSNWVWPLNDDGSPGPAFNRYISTTETKARTPRLLDQRGANCALQVYVPFKSCDFTSSSFSLCLNQKYGLAGNQPLGIQVTYEDVLNWAQNPFPNISAPTSPISVQADGYATVNIDLVDASGSHITDADADLYLDNSGGYITKRKLRTTGGSGQFRVGALGLVAGDSFNVKIGFRHYSNVAEVQFIVT